MTWEMFIEDNDSMFRREYGVRNDEGDRDVLGWVTYEGMEYASKTGAGIKAAEDWALWAAMSCDAAAVSRNHRDG